MFLFKLEYRANIGLDEFEKLALKSTFAKN